VNTAIAGDISITGKFRMDGKVFDFTFRSVDIRLTHE
jgi:hypothetical protein